MKTMMLHFGCFLMVLTTCMIIISISRKQIIQEEINEALSVASYDTMQLWVYDRNLNEDYLINEFFDIFAKNINSKSKFNFYIYELDTENGIIDIEAEAEFNYPNMKVGRVSSRKTIIYDESY